jgi:hypothetical protein
MSSYFVMQGAADAQIVLLYSLKAPGKFDNWMLARRFQAEVQEPVQATINPQNKKGILLPLYGVPQIMRRDLYETLVGAGVDNIDVYAAVVTQEDGTVVSNDYVAYNIIGAVKAADLSATEFAPENPSRMVDAGVEKMAISDEKAKGLLLFRSAESIRLIVVHENVRKAIEAKGIANIAFRGSEDGII